ncbi:NAD(P)-binding protein [Streptomyces griseorubiginosus]|uniref:NAD(P)-binding protein n=1 Tax=Streptomyces griseorubiginosus TaxID=67304 RepID=UPI0036E1DE16
MGAGISGVGAAARLRAAGIRDFLIIEAAGDVGGVSGRRASGRTPDVGRSEGECHDGERARRAAGGGVLHPGLLVLHRVPGGPPPRAAEYP